MPNRKRNLILGAVFTVLIAAVAWLFYLNMAAPSAPHEIAATGPLAGRAPAAAATADIAEEPAPAGGATMLLYFQGADVSLLFPEERAAAVETDSNAQARQVLDELVRGPTRELLPTIPEGARVREVYFDSTGIAYVDFSRELRDNHPGGSSEELMTIDSIVNTLARNVPQVQSVRFLIDGRPVATLAGHVNLSVPLPPSSDRLALVP